MAPGPPPKTSSSRRRRVYLKERMIAVVLTGADGDGEIGVRTVNQMRHAGACRAMNVNVCLIQDLLTF
jgi:hypothetical protein